MTRALRLNGPTHAIFDGPSLRHRAPPFNGHDVTRIRFHVTNSSRRRVMYSRAAAAINPDRESPVRLA